MDELPKLCVFCGKDESFGPMDAEHFVPKCLWNNNRPEFTRTVPAHKACNNANGTDNEYFRDVLIVDERVKHPEVDKLWNGKFKRRLEKRPSTIAKTFRNIGLRPRKTKSGKRIGMAPAFDVDWPRLMRVLANVMRGVFHSVKNRPLPVDCKYMARVVNDDILEAYGSLIASMTSINDFGDDVFQCRYVFNGEGVHDGIACLMQFYRCHLFYGMAIPTEVVEKSSWKRFMD